MSALEDTVISPMIFRRPKRSAPDPSLSPKDAAKVLLSLSSDSMPRAIAGAVKRMRVQHERKLRLMLNSKSGALTELPADEQIASKLVDSSETGRSRGHRSCMSDAHKRAPAGEAAPRSSTKAVRNAKLTALEGKGAAFKSYESGTSAREASQTQHLPSDIDPASQSQHCGQPWESAQVSCSLYSPSALSAAVISGFPSRGVITTSHGLHQPSWAGPPRAATTSTHTPNESHIISWGPVESHAHSMAGVVSPCWGLQIPAATSAGPLGSSSLLHMSTPIWAPPVSVSELPDGSSQQKRSSRTAAPSPTPAPTPAPAPTPIPATTPAAAPAAEKKPSPSEAEGIRGRPSKEMGQCAEAGKKLAMCSAKTKAAGSLKTTGTASAMTEAPLGCAAHMRDHTQGGPRSVTSDHPSCSSVAGSTLSGQASGPVICSTTSEPVAAIRGSNVLNKDRGSLSGSAATVSTTDTSSLVSAKSWSAGVAGQGTGHASVAGISASESAVQPRRVITTSVERTGSQLEPTRSTWPQGAAATANMSLLSPLLGPNAGASSTIPTAARGLDSTSGTMPMLHRTSGTMPMPHRRPPHASSHDAVVRMSEEEAKCAVEDKSSAMLHFLGLSSAALEALASGQKGNMVAGKVPGWPTVEGGTLSAPSVALSGSDQSTGTHAVLTQPPQHHHQHHHHQQPGAAAGGGWESSSPPSVASSPQPAAAYFHPTGAVTGWGAVQVVEPTGWMPKMPMEATATIPCCRAVTTSIGPRFDRGA